MSKRFHLSSYKPLSPEAKAGKKKPTMSVASLISSIKESGIMNQKLTSIDEAILTAATSSTTSSEAAAGGAGVSSSSITPDPSIKNKTSFINDTVNQILKDITIIGEGIDLLPDVPEARGYKLAMIKNGGMLLIRKTDHILTPSNSETQVFEHSSAPEVKVISTETIPAASDNKYKFEFVVTLAAAIEANEDSDSKDELIEEQSGLNEIEKKLQDKVRGLMVQQQEYNDLISKCDAAYEKNNYEQALIIAMKAEELYTKNIFVYKSNYPMHLMLKGFIANVEGDYVQTINYLLEEYICIASHPFHYRPDRTLEIRSEIYIKMYDLSLHATESGHKADAEKYLLALQDFYHPSSAPFFLLSDFRSAMNGAARTVLEGKYDVIKKTYIADHAKYKGVDHQKFVDGVILSSLILNKPFEDIAILCNYYVEWLKKTKTESLSSLNNLERPIYLTAIAALNQNHYDKCLEYIKLSKVYSKESSLTVALIEALATIKEEDIFSKPAHSKEVYEAAFLIIKKFICPDGVHIVDLDPKNLSDLEASQYAIAFYLCGFLSEKLGLSPLIRKLYYKEAVVLETADMPNLLWWHIKSIKNFKDMSALKILEIDADNIASSSKDTAANNRDIKIMKTEMVKSFKAILYNINSFKEASQIEVTKIIMNSYIKLQEYSESHKLYKSLMAAGFKIDKLTVNEKSLLATMLFYVNDIPSACAFINLIDKESLPSLSAHLLLNYAKTLTTILEKHEEAISIFQMLAIGDIAEEYKSDYVVALVKTGKLEEASKIAATMRNHENYSLYWYSKCNVEYTKNNFEDAIAAARKLFSKLSDEISTDMKVEIAKLHIQALYHKSYYGKALKEADNYNKQSIKLSDLNHIFAECYIKGNHSNEAKAVWKKLEQWGTNSVESYQKLIEILIEHEEYGLAKEYLDKFYDILPGKNMLEVMADRVNITELECIEAIRLYEKGEILPAIIKLEELYEGGFAINFVKKSLIEYAMKGGYPLVAIKYLEQESEPVKFASAFGINIKDIYLQAIKAYIEPGHHNLAEAVRYFGLVKNEFNNNDLAVIWGSEDKSYSNPKAEMQLYLAYICGKAYEKISGVDKSLCELASLLLSGINASHYKPQVATAIKNLFTSSLVSTEDKDINTSDVSAHGNIADDIVVSSATVCALGEMAASTFNSSSDGTY